MSDRRTLGLGSWLVAIMLTLTAAQCTRRQQAASEESDSVRVMRLEREARAIAKTEGCNAGGQCRTAPVGDRPCGGPRDYIVYCARTTDTSALSRKLTELVAAERALNRKTGAMSTCEFRLPPQTGLVNGSCRAVPVR